MQTRELNQAELRGRIPWEASWHQDYRDTSTIYIGNLHRGLSEGDLLIVFSQYGVPLAVKLARDARSGLSLGHAYIRYKDYRSAVLAVDNFDGASLLGRKLRVDHSRSLVQEVPLAVLYGGAGERGGEGERGGQGEDASSRASLPARASASSCAPAEVTRAPNSQHADRGRR